MIKKICLVCGKVFEVLPYREETAKYCSTHCMGSDKNANWSKTRFEDGHKSFSVAISDRRNTVLYKKWRKEVFERDNYTCKKCSSKNKKQLIPHHIKNYDDFPKLRLDVDNGMTLCRRCHVEIHPQIRDKNTGRFKKKG